MKKSNLILFVLLILLFSCKKDDSTQGSPNPPGPNFRIVKAIYSGSVIGPDTVIYEYTGSEIAKVTGKNSKWEYNYISDNKVEVLGYYKDSDSWEYVTKKTFDFIGSQISSIEDYYLDVSGIEPQRKRVFTYQNGFIKENISYKNSNAAWVEEEKIECSYSNDMLKEVATSLFDTSWHVFKKRVYYYTAQKLDSCIVFISNQGNLEKDLKTIFTFTGSFLTQVEYFEYVNGSYTLHSLTTYDYDANGNLERVYNDWTAGYSEVLYYHENKAGNISRFNWYNLWRPEIPGISMSNGQEGFLKREILNELIYNNK